MAGDAAGLQDSHRAGVHVLGGTAVSHPYIQGVISLRNLLMELRNEKFRPSANN